MIIRLCLVGPALLGEHTCHRQICSAIRRVPLQQRNQHLLGIVCSSLAEYRLRQCHGVNRSLAIERGGRAQMLDCIGEPLVRDKIYTDAILFRGSGARGFAIRARQCSITNDEYDDRAERQRQRKNEL